MYRRDEHGKSKATTQTASFKKPSIKPIFITPNHLTCSAQLLYPYWSQVSQDSAYVRNTEIHFFRADEQSPWTVIALPENDRYYPDANADSLEDFEQRYFKFLSGNKQTSFSEGETPHETAENAFYALRSCYPAANQNVLNDYKTKSLLLTFFSSLFTNTHHPVLLSRNKTPSEIRTEDYISQHQLKVSDYSAAESERVNVYKENSNYTKVVFDKTTVHLYLVGTEILMFADTNGFNSLDQGICTLSIESPNWAVQIQDAWLSQQVNVCLGTQFNPETKHNTPYKIQAHIPTTLICTAAKELLNNLQAKNDFEVEAEVVDQETNPTSIRNELKEKLQASITVNTATTPIRAIPKAVGLTPSTWHSIVQIIRENNTDVLLKLINENTVNANGMERGGDTILLNAVREGQIDIVKLLIEHGTDLEQKDNFPSYNSQHNALHYAVISKNKDMLMLLLQAGAKFEIDSLTKLAQENSATEIVKLLSIMKDYDLSITQANAFLDFNTEAWEWISKGFSTGLPLDVIINITAELLNLDLNDTCQVMLAVLDKFSEFHDAPKVQPTQLTQSSATSSGLFSTKLPCEKLRLIKDFITDELAAKSITSKGQYIECKAGYIKDREYGYHLGIGTNTGLAYVRDRFLSIELIGDKVCCSKGIMNGANNLVWKELTKEELIIEISNPDSLIGQIINHQQAKQEAMNTPTFS